MFFGLDSSVLVLETCFTILEFTKLNTSFFLFKISPISSNERESKAFLISPFVGRITDWYKKAEGRDSYLPHEDPGVNSVHKIYDYYKSNNIDTVVMGASFRSSDQIKALAGCDNLTIAPSLLDEMGNDTSTLNQALSPNNTSGILPISMDEATFRWEMNADPMATEKLAEGIRNFDVDHKKLIGLIAARMSA